MDEEEAARLLQESQGPGFKFDVDIFRRMAHDSKVLPWRRLSGPSATPSLTFLRDGAAPQVAFYKAVVSAKAKWAERVRRKELKLAKTIHLL